MIKKARILGMILGVLMLSLSFFSCADIVEREATLTVFTQAPNQFGHIGGSFAFPLVNDVYGSIVDYPIKVETDDEDARILDFPSHNSFKNTEHTVTYKWDDEVEFSSGLSSKGVLALDLSYPTEITLRYINGIYVLTVDSKFEGHRVYLYPDEESRYRLETRNITDITDPSSPLILSESALNQAILNGRDILFRYGLEAK